MSVVCNSIIEQAIQQKPISLVIFLLLACICTSSEQQFLRRRSIEKLLPSGEKECISKNLPIIICYFYIVYRKKIALLIYDICHE